jgi:hypothetical protein
LTARDELLASARSLVGRGVDSFSPAELIREARARGSTYTESTLRTHIVSHMCVNAPDHSAVQYADFFRIGRGRYRLNDATLNREAAAGPAPRLDSDDVTGHAESTDTDTDASSADQSWSWEGNVQAAVVRHLVARGWNIRRVANTSTKESGVDIEAISGDRRLLVEVKGYPSAHYSTGAKAGEKKQNHATQARHYFAGALLTATLMRADHPGDEVVVALPSYTTYEHLARRTAAVLEQIGVGIWLIDQSGHVRSASENTDSASG